MHAERGVRVLVVVALHRVDETDVIHHVAQMRKQIADHRAAFSAGFELPAGLEQHALLFRDAAADARRLAVSGEERGLRVERVHVRHAAIREDEDDALRLRGEMRRLRREWIADCGGGEEFGKNSRHHQRTADEGLEEQASFHKCAQRSRTVAILRRSRSVV